MSSSTRLFAPVVMNTAPPLRGLLRDRLFSMRWASRSEINGEANCFRRVLRSGIRSADRGTTWERRIASLLRTGNCTAELLPESHETLQLRMKVIRTLLPKDDRYDRIRKKLKRVEFAGRYGIGPEHGLRELCDNLRVFVAEEDYGSAWEIEVAKVIGLSPQEVAQKYGSEVAAPKEKVSVE